MPGTKHPAELQETTTELLLFIHATQKERAKAIDGRRWDPERKCWVYPRTGRVYDAIIAEFGDDMLTCSIKRPSPSSVTEQTAALQQKNEDLREELNRIHNKLEGISTGNHDGNRSEVRALEVALAARESELATLRQKLLECDTQAEALKSTAAATQAELQRLRAANTALQAEISGRKAAPVDPTTLLEKLVKEAAKDATGRHPKFTTLVDRYSLNQNLPNEFVKQLERELRKILDTDDRGLTLHDLITMAKDAELLTEKGIDLAHSLRKHRNILTHENTDPRTYQARVLLCLFAAALLWPEFAE